MSSEEEAGKRKRKKRDRRERQDEEGEDSGKGRLSSGEAHSTGSVAL